MAAMGLQEFHLAQSKTVEQMKMHLHHSTHRGKVSVAWPCRFSAPRFRFPGVAKMRCLAKF